MCEEIKKLDEILLPKYLKEDEEILNCDTKRLTQAGENYGSLMLSIDIKIRNKKTGDERVLYVVGKAVPQNEFIQKMFQSPLTFKKELEFYRTVVPTLQQFQRENGIEEVMDFFPEFYGGRMGLNSNSDDFDNDAVILLENLKVKGYYCVDRTKGFDLDEAKYILRNLATLHAVPLALKFKNPALFKEKILPHINIVKVFYGLGDDVLNSVVDGIFDIAKEKVECEPVLPNLRTKLLDSAKALKNRSQPREPFGTLTHVDFWVNNTMIRTENGTVVDNKIVDFQMPEYSSPARDLIFFIFNSIQNNIVINYYEYLVEFYHQNVIDTLKQFNVDTHDLSLQAFRDEIDLALKESVLFQCFIMLKPMFATKDDVKEIEDMDEIDMKENTAASQELKEKLWMIVTEFAKRKWL